MKVGGCLGMWGKVFSRKGCKLLLIDRSEVYQLTTPSIH